MADQTVEGLKTELALAKSQCRQFHQMLLSQQQENSRLLHEITQLRSTIKELKESSGKPARSVLQDWVMQLPRMQQSVLIAAVRGPDGIRKDHNVKVLCRWLRRSFLVSAFDGRALHDPYEEGGGSFTGRCVNADMPTLGHAVDFYLRSVDELPHHFQLHLMHAAEILGYKHPHKNVRGFWNDFYLKIVKDAHLKPETEAEMDRRLGDNEAAWREGEVVTAK